MSLIIWATAGIIVFVAFIVFLAYKVWDKSFKHPAIILVDTAKGLDIVTDRYKVKRVKGEDDFNVINFRSNVFDKSFSPPFSLWQRVFKKEKRHYDKLERFNDKQIRRMMSRGCIFYQPQEGQLHPVSLEVNDDDVDLKPFTQDNRALLVSMIQRDEKQKQDSAGKWRQVLMVLGPVVMSLIVSAVIIITTLTLNSDNVAAICGQANAASGSFVGAVQGAVGG